VLGARKHLSKSQGEILEEKGKCSFLKKRTKKLLSVRGGARSSTRCAVWTYWNKSFCFFFSKKMLPTSQSQKSAVRPYPRPGYPAPPSARPATRSCPAPALRWK